MIGLYHKILVPLDGSALAEQVLPHLQRFASPIDTTFVLVNVINSANYVATHSRYLPPDYFTRLRTNAKEYLAEQQRPLDEAGFRVEAYVADSDAAGSILHLAAKTQADLIAMTTHGRSGFVRWALGSVAERIVSETALPVFLVRETTALPTDKLHRILVPLDGSAQAEQALPTAGALAKATGAELLLLQVLQPLDDRNQEILFKDAADAQAAFADWQANAEAYLHQQAQPFQAEEVTCRYQALLGDVAPTMIDTATNERIDLLVMSTHGRSGLRRWVYGSVANKVLRGVTCPLLLIRQSAPGQSG